jgi:hypothetical protein
MMRRRLIRRSPGYYYYLNFNVERSGTSGDRDWRWYDADNPSVGGEWRGSLRAARLDLDAFLDARNRVTS